MGILQKTPFQKTPFADSDYQPNTEVTFIFQAILRYPPL